MKKNQVIAVLLIILFAGGYFGYRGVKSYLFSSPKIIPTPTLSPFVQLTPDKYPEVSLDFSADGHYVTVKISKVNADKLEYNLIYDATVKKNQIQTGVSASQSMEGKTEYSKNQLLGSESSGKFTYHDNIKNASLELTLRDSAGRSIFFATYPFTFKPSSSVSLKSE